jgi:HSP20 family molecular chaperone IbpA
MQPIQGEKHMTSRQLEKTQSVPVIEADILDEMNETNSLIAQRAYEIYQSRGGGHGSDQDDWFRAAQEILPKLEIDYDVSDSAVRLTAQGLDFAAKDLEVVIGHRRAVICGFHPSLNRTAGGSRDKRIMKVVELPFAVDPVSARAALQNGTLQVVLPRLAEDNLSQFGRAAGL